jgi:hypothetical protein
MAFIPARAGSGRGPTVGGGVPWTPTKNHSENPKTNVENAADSRWPGLPGYRLVRQLAQDPVSALYLAEDTAHDRTVTVKVFEPESTRDPEFPRRLRAAAA